MKLQNLRKIAIYNMDPNEIETFQSAGDRFNLTKSTAHGIFIEVTTLIACLRYEMIWWPNEYKRRHISQQSEMVSGKQKLFFKTDVYFNAIKHTVITFRNSRYNWCH